MGRNQVGKPPLALPEGVILEEARQLSGLTQRKAAHLAGMSDARWRQVVNGWRVDWPDKHAYVPIKGKPPTIARMAIAVGLGPNAFAQCRPDVSAELIRRQVVDAPHGPTSFGPARLAEMLAEIKEVFGSELFEAAMSLLREPPPPETQRHKAKVEL